MTTEEALTPEQAALKTLTSCSVCLAKPGMFDGPEGPQLKVSLGIVLDAAEERADAAHATTPDRPLAEVAHEALEPAYQEFIAAGAPGDVTPEVQAEEAQKWIGYLQSQAETGPYAFVRHAVWQQFIMMLYRFINIRPGLAHAKRAAQELRLTTDPTLKAEFARIQREGLAMHELANVVFQAVWEHGTYAQMPIQTREHIKRLMDQGPHDRLTFLTELAYHLYLVGKEPGTSHQTRLEDLIRRYYKRGDDERSMHDALLLPIAIVMATDDLAHSYGGTMATETLVGPSVFMRWLDNRRGGSIRQKNWGITRWHPTFLEDFCGRKVISDGDRRVVRAVLQFFQDFYEQPPRVARRDRGPPPVVRLLPEYRGRWESAFQRSPTKFLAQQEEIMPDVIAHAFGNRPPDSNQNVIDWGYRFGKVRTFTIKRPGHPPVRVVSKQVDPLGVRSPEQEIDMAARLAQRLESDPTLLCDVQRFIGMAYDQGNFYLLSLFEDSPEMPPDSGWLKEDLKRISSVVGDLLSDVATRNILMKDDVNHIPHFVLIDFEGKTLSVRRGLGEEVTPGTGTGPSAPTPPVEPAAPATTEAPGPTAPGETTEPRPELQTTKVVNQALRTIDHTEESP